MLARLSPLLPTCARLRLASLLAALLVSACGGGGGGAAAPGAEPAPVVSPPTVVPAAPAPPEPVTVPDAVRLASQASFGATEALVEEIRAASTAGWLAAQMRAAGSRYTSGGGDALHRETGTPLCERPGAAPTCWRENHSTQPLVRDFYRNAVTMPDQLRQRVAFALQQILVVSNVEVDGTYGFRRYHNALLDGAFGNYRALLRHVIRSPLMGDYLGHVNNHAAAPNENFARELLQLFSIGTCRLAADGTLADGRCSPNYDNEAVRAYAYALTGWTYPAGGNASTGCWPAGANCRYYDGEMVPLPAYRDGAERRLLSGITVPAGTDATTAMERVLDSLMAHPSMAPFIARQLIQHLVTSNPSPRYVARVAAAFESGRHAAGGQVFGTGVRGDLAATVAAVLLDADARRAEPGSDFGRLREPVLLFTGVLRALDGTTDGEPFGFWIGGDLQQNVFRPPTVFSFFPPEQPLRGTALVAPAFAIHNTNTALARMNVLAWLIDRGGAAADPARADALPTRVDLSRFAVDAAGVPALVDRLATLAAGAPLPAAARAKVITAVTAAGNATADAAEARLARARTAAYLVFASPQFQVQR